MKVMTGKAKQPSVLPAIVLSIRSGEDPKLIETDAIIGKADFLLEILMVPDRGAPLGVGFKVTVTNVKSGAEVVSLYTDAIPQMQQQPSHYVITESGFEKRQPRAQASVADVGVALARQAMQSMGPRIGNDTTK
jgi:hypothetical protein